MIPKLEKKLKGLESRYPQWKATLKAYLDGQREELDPDAMNQLMELIAEICDSVKQEKISEEEGAAIFGEEMAPGVRQMIHSRLRPFYDFSPIRTLEEKMLPQIKNILDTVWDQYVIRFNPELRLELPNPMTEEELHRAEQALEAIANFCVSRTFSYEGILGTVRQQLVLSDELSEFIARRIDRDYSELRLNYLVQRVNGIPAPLRVWSAGGAAASSPKT